VVAVGLQLVFTFGRGLPAVGLGEQVAPEIDAFGNEGADVAQVATGTELAERHQVPAIHAEQGVHHLKIARRAHGVIGQTRVLPPIARAPAAIVGVAGLLLGGHGEQRTVELERILAAPGAGGHETLQGVSPRNDLRVVALDDRGRGAVAARQHATVMEQSDPAVRADAHRHMMPGVGRE